MKENTTKTILITSVICVLIISITIGIVLTGHKEEVSIPSNENMKIMSEQTQTDIVIIKNGNIENEKLIDEILQQGKLDAKYGICEEAYYKDGGSIEYQYPKYTVLKYHSLDGNGDFVIGSTGAAGQIINEVREVLYK